MKPPLFKAALVAVACLAFACDGENESMPMDASNPIIDANLETQRDGGAGSDGAVAPKSPLVVVTERESPDGPEGSLKYLHVMPELPASRKLDARTAVELPPGSLAYSGNGSVWVYQPEGANVQKYLVDAQLGIKPDVKISFASYGVTGYDPDNVWVSPERAFLVDEASGQIILWNPRTMTIVRSTPIDPALLKKNGLKLQLQEHAVVAGGRAWMSANWRNWETYDHVPGAALAWFDTALDAPTLNAIHEDRCAPSIDVPFVDELGNVYVIGDGGLGFDVIASPKKSALPQCVRRVLAGQTQFDPNFFVDLQAVTGSPGFRDSHPMPMGKLLLNLWAPSLKVADYAMPSPDWYWKDGLTVFEYVIVDLISKTALPVSTLPRAAAEFSTTLRVDGINYVQSYRADKSVMVSRVNLDGSVMEVLDLGPGQDLQYIGRL